MSSEDSTSRVARAEAASSPARVPPPLSPAPVAGASGRGTDGRALPGLRDPALCAVLGLAAALQCLSWWHLHGYQLADSVEFMERAQSFARGEAQDRAGAIRSFGFSVLLSPFFLAADRLGIQEGRLVVAAVRIFQMLLGLGLVVVCARIGARLAGRAAGVAAGFFVAVNPIFLQYTVSPVSGVAAALFIGLATERLMERARPLRAFTGGLFLGAAFLMAYQTILVSVPLLVLVLLRDFRQARRLPALACVGLLSGIAFQVWLDRVTWGQWGISVGNYLAINSGLTLATLFARIGLMGPARWMYERVHDLTGFAAAGESSDMRQLQPRWYYFSSIQSMLVLPVLALGVVGVLRALVRPRWSAWILILAFAANAFVMSQKGAKSFRLWLPLLPLIAPICAFGWALVAGAARARLARPRTALAGVLLLAATVLGVQTLLELNTRRHGVYWRAMELVNAEAERARADALAIGTAMPRTAVASAYHWAVFHRESPAVLLVKLPHHLHLWPSLDEVQRAACIERLRELDWFLTHRPVLEQDQALFDAVNRGFELADCFWELETDAALGPVLALRRRSGRPGARLLCEVLPPEDPEGYRRRLGLDRALLQPLDFAGRSSEGGPFDRRLTLLGWDHQVLPESGIGWIRYHWTTPTGVEGDYTIIDRVTEPEGRNAWQNNHRACYGFYPTDRWHPGEIVRESYPMLAGSEPFTDRFVPMGGAWRRGDLVPAQLWMAVALHDEERGYHGALRPTRFGAMEPIEFDRATPLSGIGRRSPDGFVESSDRLLLVGRFLLPVHPDYRWPDDGRGDPP